MEEGSWRDQLGRASAGNFGTSPHVVLVSGDYSTTQESAPPPPYWVPPEPIHPDPSLQYLEANELGGCHITERDLNHLELELALALALRDYVRKSGIRSLCLALSGGRDSAMV